MPTGRGFSCTIRWSHLSMAVSGRESATDRGGHAMVITACLPHNRPSRGRVGTIPTIPNVRHTMRVMLVHPVAGMGTLIAASPLQAEEPKSPVTAIKAARLFDGKSDELVRP